MNIEINIDTTYTMGYTTGVDKTIGNFLNMEKKGDIS